MSEEIKFDHFKDINELLEHIDLWYREDDIEYTRWFGLEDLHILKIYITSLQQKVEQLEKEIDRLNNIILNQQKRIDKTIQAIDEILIYNDLSDTTSAFGNAPRELKFYLSECDTLEEFDKLKELKENNK